MKRKYLFIVGIFALILTSSSIGAAFAEETDNKDIPSREALIKQIDDKQTSIERLVNKRKKLQSQIYELNIKILDLQSEQTKLRKVLIDNY